MTLGLDTAERHELTVVASLYDLSVLEAHQRSRSEERSTRGVNSEWTNADHDQLRRFLLEHAPDHWLVLQRVVDVV